MGDEPIVVKEERIFPDVVNDYNFQNKFLKDYLQLRNVEELN